MGLNTIDKQPVSYWSSIQHRFKTKSTPSPMEHQHHHQQQWRTKTELFDDLSSIETGLTKSQALYPNKRTTKELGLIKELKDRLEECPDDIRIPIYLRVGRGGGGGRGGQPDRPVRKQRTTCPCLCTNSTMEEVELLEHKLMDALAFLREEEGDSSTSTSESDSVEAEIMAHDAEFEVRDGSSRSIRSDLTDPNVVGNGTTTTDDWKDDIDGGIGCAPADAALSPTAQILQLAHIQNDPPSLPTLRKSCTTEYSDLLSTQTITVFPLSTYQGRNKRSGLDSSNGCTVISPLIAAAHLSSDDTCIPDGAIEHIIDTVAPPILKSIRSKMGISPFSFITPSDAHDVLVDNGTLKQEKFVGVCTGNLLNLGHVEEFLDMMESGNESGCGFLEEEKKEEAAETVSLTQTPHKVAASLFFRKHVVSIVKIVFPNGKCAYDLVDSLPQKLKNGKRGATRTRCEDRDSLRTLLFWFALNNLTKMDERYINSNRWEMTHDSDPRLFQAFAWRE